MPSSVMLGVRPIISRSFLIFDICQAETLRECSVNVSGLFTQLSTRLVKSGAPSVGPSCGSTIFSGCGINPQTLLFSLKIPAIARALHSGSRWGTSHQGNHLPLRIGTRPAPRLQARQARRVTRCNCHPHARAGAGKHRCFSTRGES